MRMTINTQLLDARERRQTLSSLVQRVQVAWKNVLRSADGDVCLDLVVGRRRVARFFALKKR